ncbi:MAG: phenylalanine--tRNA ligase subunit alpha [Thermoplasmatota archaeon]
MDIKQTIKELSQNEKKVLLVLNKLDGKASPKDIFDNGDFDQEVEVAHAASWLQSKKLVIITDHINSVYSLGKEGKRFIEQGLPEKKALKVLSERDGVLSLKELGGFIDTDDLSIAIGWLKKNDWVTICKDKETVIKITEKGKAACSSQSDDEKMLVYLRDNEGVEIPREKISSLLSRKNVVKEKEVISSTITLTDEGREVLKHGFDLIEEISQITSAVIKNADWKKKMIRPYDIYAFAPALYGGKPHPLVGLIETIRQIFIQMGFEEIQGDFVESCFWNMDVLFIPQDHPAREMQDTLYCKTPKSIPIADEALCKKIADVHEHGGDTASSGWGYKFSQSEAERVLLRTHSTVNTIRYLYHNPDNPCKVFSIGRVFRKENIDATHLPEFYQIEGIVHEKGTNFRQLIGVLKEFYKRMGFETIRFRPGYFPYTEPSMEVEVFWNGEWMELGGSGIFRPEVTEPVGVKHPVLAWGLGLERLAMLKFGVTDIRSLYISDLSWLQKKPLL